MSNRIQLDLTPWVRAPQSGVGRTARKTFEAVRTALGATHTSGNLHLTAVARSSKIPKGHQDEVRRIGLLERGMGSPGTLHHAFEHRLAPLRRCTRLLSIHDLWTLRDGNPYQSPKFQQAQAPLLKKAIQRADWITTPLPSVLDELHRIFPDTRNRSSHIPWASTLTAGLQPSELQGFAPQKPLILTIAVVENRKNLLQLARALSGNPHIDWLLLGKVGFGGEKILPEIQRHFPAVHHRSEVTEAELAWAYKNAAAVVLPSLEEGFGLPVLEASYFGTPLVLSRIPAFTDIVGKTGGALFFDSEGGLREILEHLRGHPEDWRLPDSRRIAQGYSWAGTAELFTEIYRKLGFALT